MFPMVPYHALPKLHEVMKPDCPPPYSSTWAVYREVLGGLILQWRDPSYYVRRPLPPSRAHSEAPTDQLAGAA